MLNLCVLFAVHSFCNQKRQLYHGYCGFVEFSSLSFIFVLVLLIWLAVSICCLHRHGQWTTAVEETIYKQREPVIYNSTQCSSVFSNFRYIML